MVLALFSAPEPEPLLVPEAEPLLLPVSEPAIELDAAPEPVVDPPAATEEAATATKEAASACQERVWELHKTKYFTFGKSIAGKS